MQSPFKEAPESSHFAGFWQDCLQKKVWFCHRGFCTQSIFSGGLRISNLVKKRPKKPKNKVTTLPR